MSLPCFPKPPKSIKYFGHPEEFNTNVLAGKNISLLLNLVSMYDVLTQENELDLITMGSPGTIEIGTQESKEYVIQYVETLQWVLNLLDQNEIVYSLKEINIVNQKKQEGARDLKSRRSFGFFVEFEGQTWCPALGFMAFEQLCSLPLKEYALNHIREPHLKYSMHGADLLGVKEKLDWYSIDDAEKETLEINQKLNALLNSSLRDPETKPCFILYKEEPEMDSDGEVSSDIHVMGSFLPSKTGCNNTGKDLDVLSDPVHVFDMNLSVQNTLMEKLKWAHFDVDFGAIGNKLKNASENVEEYMEILNVLGWKEAFEESWNKLLALESDDGDVISFFNQKVENGKVLQVQLKLDLKNPEVGSEMMRFLALKSSILRISENTYPEAILGRDFDKKIGFRWYSSAFPNCLVPDYRSLKASKNMPKVTLSFVKEANRGVEEFIGQVLLEDRLLKQVKPARPTLAPLNPNRF